MKKKLDKKDIAFEKRMNRIRNLLKPFSKISTPTENEIRKLNSRINVLEYKVGIK
jgi:hypothetical protein